MHRLLATSLAALSLSPFLAQADDVQDTIIVISQRHLSKETEVTSRLGLGLCETPATVDVLTQDDLQQQGTRTAIEALNSAPGLASGNLPGSVASVSVRGFHRAVNYLYDGVRQANSDAGMRDYDSWMFERVEVIKGPASVASGEGALAGAINFVPRQPKLGQHGGEVFASYGSHGTARVAGDLNLPFGDKVALRADLSYAQSAGWIDNTDSEKIAGRLALLIQPSDKLSVTVSADRFGDQFDTAYYGTPLVSAEIARNPSDIVSGSAGLVLDEAMQETNFNVTDGDMDSETTWLRARADYQLSANWTLVSDTSWYTSDRKWIDADEYSFNAGTGLIDRFATHITHDHQYWSERLHAAFDGDLLGRRNRFTVGIEVSDTDFFTERRFGTATSTDPFNPARSVFPPEDPLNFTTRQDVTADVKSVAYFAEDAYNLTPKWLIVGGLRLDTFNLDRKVDDLNADEVSIYGRDYDPVTWRIGTVYSVRPTTQLYTQYTSAATPVTGLFFMSSSRAAFDVTTGDSFEFGIKSSMLDDRLQLTASLYAITQNDILTRDPIDPSLTIQGGRQGSEGAELTVSWRPTDEWSATLSGTILNAEFDELIEGGGLDRSGNRPPNSPEHLADLVVAYVPRALPLSFTGSVRHNGDFFTSNANDVKVGGFTLVDAAVSWEVPLGRLTLRGRNLTDEFYADWSGYASGLVFVGEPRSVELSLSREF
jgi:iron complex outermembrane receptor protein